jgi:hypothetical protein
MGNPCLFLSALILFQADLMTSICLIVGLPVSKDGIMYSPYLMFSLTDQCLSYAGPDSGLTARSSIAAEWGQLQAFVRHHLLDRMGSCAVLAATGVSSFEPTCNDCRCYN